MKDFHLGWPSMSSTLAFGHLGPPPIWDQLLQAYLRPGDPQCPARNTGQEKDLCLGFPTPTTAGTLCEGGLTSLCGNH